ncbi:MAG: helix-turn-helix transcriptional regulator [Ruminiclostridium sp.]|nr:helix-turn-helix transcriptional regulator [Ruminiclostridium sp.]
MDFKRSFQEALHTSHSCEKEISVVASHLKILSVPMDIAWNLPYIEAFGTIPASCPFVFEIPKLDSFCMIYTERGSGLLISDGRSDILNQGSIGFIQCNQSYKIEAVQAPWLFKIFFIAGPPVFFFYSGFVRGNGNHYSYLPGNIVTDRLQLLYDCLTQPSKRPLYQSRFLSDILFEILMEKGRLYEEKPNVYDYVYEIKHDLDYNYMNNITLKQLEIKYHISKYQICREFKKQFHISPIQYLNQRKIEAAKEILLQTNKPIIKISKMVGFENPNNLIRQFKKQCSVTPLVYRRQARVKGSARETTCQED